MPNAVIVLVVLFGILLLLLLWGVAVYNQLVKLKNRFENAFAQIDVQLKRRHDLIPNLVEVARGFMKHERETLEGVIRARNAAVSGLERAAKDPADPAAMTALMGAESALTGAVGRLFALAEAYPDLKANQNMLALQEELTSTENKITFARQGYNDSVTTYNTYKQTFPPVLIAGMFGHGRDATLLEFDRAAIAEPPKVSFAG
ncbi:MAG: LemA family protein [Planctomycetota bacterium]